MCGGVRAANAPRRELWVGGADSGEWGLSRCAMLYDDSASSIANWQDIPVAAGHPNR